MQKAVDDGVFPGAVLAVRFRSRMQYIQPVGRLSYGPDSPFVRPSTFYDLASLTKPLVTVTSIALLVQHRTLRLEDPVCRVLSELERSAIGQATVKDLLTHSSGLPGWRPLYERLAAKGLSPAHAMPTSVREAAVQLIGEEPLIYEKGAKSLYSDLGFILLGAMIERVTGLTLDRWYEQAVASVLHAGSLMYCPLSPERHGSPVSGLDRTSIAPTEYDEWRNTLLQGEVHDENAAALGGVAGHAGLFGVAESVLAVSGAWLQACQDKKAFLDPAVARRFTARGEEVPDSTWALGWDTPSTPSSSGRYFSPESFGHLGYTGTSLWIDPARDLEVVLLSNRVHPTRRNEKIREFRPSIHDLVAEECMKSV
ncbi:MAG TPA: serine hydrolase [Nitrospira sp.]|nr:serine hydrolase [Nitrospira sp.]